MSFDMTKLNTYILSPMEQGLDDPSWREVSEVCAEQIVKAETEAAARKKLACEHMRAYEVTEEPMPAYISPWFREDLVSCKVMPDSDPS